MHRDIKPANVMVNRDGRVMLMDFGLAKPADDSQSSLVNLIVGTPRYMAPEQMVGGQVDHASDYFAMGCVIYEMLTGEPLIPETDWLNLLRHHASWNLPDFERIFPGKDPATYEVLRGCLQSDPQHRRLALDELSRWARPIDVQVSADFDNQITSENPKHEIRNKSKISNPNVPNISLPLKKTARFAGFGYGNFEHSNLFRISTFGFRIFRVGSAHNCAGHSRAMKRATHKDRSHPYWRAGGL